MLGKNHFPNSPSMRNSTREHNVHLLQSPWQGWRIGLLFLLFPIAVAGSGAFSLTREDMVSIRADKGWEDDEPDTMYFEGHFEIRIRDWRATADRAVLNGKLDDPDQLLLDGKPARFEVSYQQGNRTERVQAEASVIIYERKTRLIRLSGNAQVLQGDSLLRSSAIEYDIGNNRFRTEGSADVQIKTEAAIQAGGETN